MAKEEKLIAVFGAVFIFSIIMIFAQQGKLTGYATSGSTFSNVTITSFLSIDMSSNLASGIEFGNVSDLPAPDVNASHNYDGGSSASTMFINVSTDSNSAVDFCNKANAGLTDSIGGNVIELGNETYGNSSTSDATTPSVTLQTALTTNYIKAQANVAIGNVTY